MGKRDKGLVLRFLGRITGYSRQQLTRLIAQYRAMCRIEDRRKAPAKPFATRDTTQDVALLAEVDALHGTLSGSATKNLCERAWERFGDHPLQGPRKDRRSRTCITCDARGSYVRQRGKVAETRLKAIPKIESLGTLRL